MNKQEFLAMSLPYGLHCEISNKKVCYKLANYTASDYTLEFNDKSVICTPILHPLSDLTKEIEHKGEKFVPIEKIQEIRGIVTVNQYFINDFKQSIRDKSISFDLVLILCKWHFNLMDDGEEFVDVNTLPENPYK